MIPVFIHLCILYVSLVHISAVPAVPSGPTSVCRPIADVVFLLDGSDSISDQEFQQQIDFVRRFLTHTDIGPDAIRVGLAVVSTRLGDEFPLSLNASKDKLLQVLDGLSQPQEGSRTDVGLVKMEQMFSRHGRRGVSRVGVVLTDGRAKYIRATEGEARVVKDAGIFLIAVGVGRLIKFTELEKIASTRNNAYTLEPIDRSTKYLTDTVKFLGQESCTGHLLVNEMGLKPPAHIAEANKTISRSNTGRSIPNEATRQVNDPFPSLDGNLQNRNSFGRVIGTNIVNEKSKDIMSISNTFDIKMEPFVAMETQKAKLPVQDSSVTNGNLVDNSGATGIKLDLGSLSSSLFSNMTEISNMLPLSDLKQSFNRFTIPQSVLSPSPVLPVLPPTKTVTTTTPSPNTTPKLGQTTSPVTNSRVGVISYQEPNPTPSETANMIIQSLLSNKGFNSGLFDGMNAMNVQIPTKPPTGNAYPEIVPTKGVGVRLPERKIGETLAFLKTNIHPPRTIEEHLNPVFKMFDKTGTTGQSSWRTDSATKPAQTTVSPREAFQLAEKAAMRDQCSNGRFVDGVAYIAKAGSCSEFLQCFQEAGQLQVRKARCPFETFFDEQHSVCKFHEQQMCYTDPCADRMMTSYDHQGNCRAYWSCRRGQSVPKCCPSGTSYVQGFGCARNSTCTDTCMDFGNLNAIIKASECKLLAMDADPHFYFEHVAGMGWVVRMCAQGLQFDQITCKCKGANEVIVDVCKPELYMDFQSGLVDISGNNLALGVYNVELDGGTGAFFGKSHLKLWRFSGMSLGQHVTISFRFRTSVTAKKGKLMHIVSNCCYSCKGQPEPSLDIAIIPADNGGIAVFSTTTKEAGEMFLFVPFKDTFTGWNNLEYKYDGMKMVGTVNGNTEQKNIVGNIVGKPEPLLIGACGMANAYDGFIDEFKFYMCNP